MVAGACALATAAPGAFAGTGGGGGAVYFAVPKVSTVKCIRKCASSKRARPGSILRIQGSELESVKRVVFLGSFGRSDDAVARVRAGSTRRLSVRVPLGATTGPLSVEVSRAVRSRRTRSIPIMPPLPPEPNPRLTPVPGPRDPGAPRLETGTSRTKVFYAAHRAVVFSYRVRSGPAATVQVQLVRAQDGTAVKSWSATAEPGRVQSVVWSGYLGVTAAPPGRYSFRVTAQGHDGARAQSAAPTDQQRDAFDLYTHIFPIRARHDYGGSGARFGASRPGHTHQGQDVLAACGSRLVAARGGRVQYSGYHSAAGYYLVIDGSGTDVDYVYMHMAQPSPFRKGDRVFTRQQIGTVGETGDAHGCHLHFELWRGGWYEGGQPFDPLPSLQAWDSWS